MKFEANCGHITTLSNLTDHERDDSFHIRLNPNITYVPLLFVSNGKSLNSEFKYTEDFINRQLFSFNEFISSVSVYDDDIPNDHNAFIPYINNRPHLKLQFIKHCNRKLLELKDSLLSAFGNTIIKPDFVVIREKFKTVNAYKATSKHYINGNASSLMFSTYKDQPVYYYSLPYAMFTTKETKIYDDLHTLSGTTKIEYPAHTPDTLQYVLTIHRNYVPVAKYLDGCLDSKYYKLFVRQDLLSEHTTHPHLKNYFNKMVVPFCKSNEIEIIGVPDLTRMYHRTIEKPKSLKDTNILVDQAIKRFEECLPILSL